MCAWEQVLRVQWSVRLSIFPEELVVQHYRPPQQPLTQGGGDGPLGHTPPFQGNTGDVVFSKLGEVLALQHL